MVTKTKAKTKDTSNKKTTTPDYKIILTEVIDLSQALVREVDNIMESQLPPAQVGKILGDIITGYQQRLEEHKKAADIQIK